MDNFTGVFEDSKAWHLKGDKPMVIIVLGGPGSGKGTQSEYIKKNYGFDHLSAGELLRTEVESSSSDGKMISNYLENGKIVPSRITVSLLSKAIERSQNNKFIIDGFPRNVENNLTWESNILNRVYMPFVLFFTCPLSVMKDRLMKRGQTSGRNDDNITSIMKRFTIFQEDTMGIIDYYDRKNKVLRVDGNRPISEVSRDVKVIFERLMHTS